MKLSACVWILCVACSLDAQQPAPQQSASPAKTIQMAPARAVLDHGLDAKKLRQGDAVTAKLQQDVKIPDAPELPKNTVLMGHVDQVQPSEHKSDSLLQITFDKAQLKNGQQLPIKATVMQVAPPMNAMMMDQQADGAPAAPMASPAMSSAPSGGTAPGGAQTTAPPPMPSASMPDQPQAQQQPQGIPGVELKSDIHEQDSATFTAKGKNVHLPEGMQMQMAVAVIPPNVQVK
ncbi:MAG: hypothetical protein IRZ03_10035 [Acidobacterium ailaaui]|nr:hypothetical protein [Pseudacidobacterium ailaaui]